MTLDEYQKMAVGTAVYPGRHGTLGLMYVALKLCGEAGEFAEHLGKAIRDDGWQNGYYDLNNRRVEKLHMELGDVLWYIAAAAVELDSSLEQIAAMNLEKLADRAARGKLGGSGDDR